MCGHVGVAGKLEHKDEALMKRLLLLDYFRGPDSTGFAALRNNGELKIAKMASHPLDLFDTKKFQDALSGWNSNVFLGHNRLATKGIVNAVNAHPYEYGHIIGAHNGTLDANSWKDLEELLGEKTNVDSQAIFACIEKFGIEETVKHLRGAWALVWINLSDNSLNFLRNKERSFWYAYSDKFDKVFWASEYHMIQAATGMSPVKYDMYSEKDTGHTYWGTEIDYWYRFDLEELKKGGQKPPKPRVKQLKGKEPVPAVTYHNGHSPFVPKTGTVTHIHGKTTTTTSTGSTGSKSTDSEVARNFRHLQGSKAEPFGGYIDKATFEEIARYGCSWCGSDVEFDEPGVVIYEKDNSILCPTCSGEVNHSRIYVDPERATILNVHMAS